MTKKIVKLMALGVLLGAAAFAFSQPVGVALMRVDVAPSGLCQLGDVPQWVKSTGVLWTCQGIAHGQGTWTALPTSGSGSGTVNTGTGIAYYPTPGTAAVSGSSQGLLDDPFLGQGHQSALNASIQPQNFYALNSSYNAIANMYSGSGNSPSQLRVGCNGDSTTQFHCAYILSTMTAKYGSNGFDFGGNGGTQYVAGQPVGAELLQTTNSSSGTVTINNGTTTPFDYTRSPNGVVTNLASGASIVYGGGGTSSYGDHLRVYYLIEPQDGISLATPGTMTVTATSSAGGTCPTGCVIFSGSLSNATTVGKVLTVVEPLDLWTITIAASSGAIDVKAVGIYSTATNGIISMGGTGRGGLGLPDSVSTPTAVTLPWYQAATGAPFAITSWAISSNVVTFQVPNNFVSGQKVVIGGLTTGNFMNGVNSTGSGSLTVLAGGLSSTQFSANLTHADASATEAGLVLSSDSNAIMGFEMKFNGVNNGQTTGPTACYQATTAAPTIFQPYSYWMNQYIAQWKTTGNPLMDLFFTGSYDVNQVCTHFSSEVTRQIAQASGLFYYDNYFPTTYANLETYGMLADSVHSSFSEQLGHSMGLWNALGLDSYLGVEQKPVADTSVATVKLWVGGGGPQTPITGLCNPASPTLCASKYAAGFSMYINGSYNSFLDATNQFSIGSVDGSAHFLCIKTTSVGGTLPSGCFNTIDNAGHVTFMGTNNPQVTITQLTTGGAGLTIKGIGSGGAGPASIVLQGGASSAFVGQQFEFGSTEYWRSGLNSSTNYQIKDSVGAKAVLDFPNNVMPASSYSGNASGPLLGGTLMQSTIYTAAGTALPSCASGVKGAMVLVGDATVATPGSAYVSGGTYTIHAECTLNSSGSVYAWQIM